MSTTQAGFSLKSAHTLTYFITWAINQGEFKCVCQDSAYAKVDDVKLVPYGGTKDFTLHSIRWLPVMSISTERTMSECKQLVVIGNGILSTITLWLAGWLASDHTHRLCSPNGWTRGGSARNRCHGGNGTVDNAGLPHSMGYNLDRFAHILILSNCCSIFLE